MKSVKQIKILQMACKAQLTKFEKELEHVNHAIMKKQNILKQVSAYSDEYNQHRHDRIGNKVPSLAINKQNFVKKLNDMIVHEQTELERLELIRNGIMNQLNEIHGKLSFLEAQEKSVRAAEMYQESSREQVKHDDIATHKKIKDEL